MNLLIVSQHFWPEPFRISDFASALRVAGCEVTVLTGQPNYPEGRAYRGYSCQKLSEDFHDGIKVYRVPLVPRGQGSALGLTLNYLSFVASASLFGAWKLREKKFDYVLVYGTSPILQALPALLIGKIKKSKVIVWVQDLWPESLSATGYVYNKSIINAVRKLVSWMYKKSNLLLAQSEAFVTEIKKYSGHTPVRYFPQPAEVLITTSKRCPLRFGNEFNIVFAGNLGAAQSLDTIIDAAKMLSERPDIKFWLIGSGSEENRIRQRTLDENVQNIEMPGRFPVEEMAGIFKQASALLVSLADQDILNKTIPGKVQTYLAQGKPIIASMNGEGARIILEAGAGIASPAGDAKGLARAALNTAQQNHEALALMGKSGLAYYQTHFEIHSLAKGLIKIMQDQEQACPANRSK